MAALAEDIAFGHARDMCQPAGLVSRLGELLTGTSGSAGIAPTRVVRNVAVAVLARLPVATPAKPAAEPDLHPVLRVLPGAVRVRSKRHRAPASPSLDA